MRDYEDLPDWLNRLFWAVVVGIIIGGLALAAYRVLPRG